MRHVCFETCLKMLWAIYRLGSDCVSVRELFYQHYPSAEVYRKYHLPVQGIIGQPLNTVNVAPISTRLSPNAVFRQKLPRRQCSGGIDANVVPSELWTHNIARGSLSTTLLFVSARLQDCEVCVGGFFQWQRFRLLASQYCHAGLTSGALFFGSPQGG